MNKLIPSMLAVALAACGKNMDSASNNVGPETTIAIVNGDFEQIGSDGTIPGWITQQHAGPPSYEMVIDAHGPYAGHGSFRMTRTHDQVYGTLSQDVDVAGVAGGTVELTAMVRTKDVGPNGWKLMISGDHVRELSPAQTGTSEWHKVGLRAQVPVGTTRITIAATLLDGGSGWLDDVELKAVAR